MALPGTAAIPAVDSQRLVAAEESGKAAVRLAHQPILPSQIITTQSVENAFRILMALGGSTNAVVHLTAVAGRARHSHLAGAPQCDLRRDAGARRPEARRRRLHGGLQRGRRRRRGAARAARTSCTSIASTVDGTTLRERLEAPLDWVDRKVIRPRRRARSRRRAGSSCCAARSRPTARSSSAPRRPRRCSKSKGARSCSKASRTSLRASTIPRSTCTPDDILVLKNAGPHGAAMPEAGLPADPVQARARGRQGHGAHFRRAHERHGLRDDRAAHVARGGDRRAARRRAQRRPHRVVGGEQAHRPAGRRARDRATARVVDAARGTASVATRRCIAAACCRRPRVATSISWWGAGEGRE